MRAREGERQGGRGKEEGRRGKGRVKQCPHPVMELGLTLWLCGSRPQPRLFLSLHPRATLSQYSDSKVAS